MDPLKVHNLAFNRVELVSLLAALESTYHSCNNPDCTNCDEYRRLAERIEKKLPRSMVVMPTVFWRKKQSL